MNRFRTKKKAREAETSPAKLWNEDVPSQPLKSSKTFRLGRKTPEPSLKPDVDLSSALPSEDDFRTSLLMSGLSARFSMLREQDDPNTKIGKASDDSVLFPKRQSRMNDFGFQKNNLFDIAEVASIRSDVRRPFADQRDSSVSLRDSYATDEEKEWTGSVMTRPRPNEGNNLFGGRQKVYKIPVGATAPVKNLPETEVGSGMSGRAVYENDVNLSSYQKLRERERLERVQSEAEAEESSRPSSPLVGYNRNRETSSTTSSGPYNTRSSTAATSVTSGRAASINGGQGVIAPAGNQSVPGLERSATKGRRLWESASEQHLHEQQAAALHRFDTISKQRTFEARTPPSGQSSPNVANISERFDRPYARENPGLRAVSPPPMAPMYSSVDVARSATDKSFGVSPPLSPPMSESDDNPILPIQPNDRGKATAMGAFQKPIQPYDEQKFMQRQLQLQHGRQTPPLRKQSSPAPYMPPVVAARNRAESAAALDTRSRSASVAVRPLAGAVPEDSQLKLETTVPEDPATGTFLNSPNASSVDSTHEESIGVVPPHLRAAEAEHSDRKQRVWADYTADDQQTPAISVSKTEGGSDPSDSPTLGPASGHGLRGMVRQHLRSDSNASSMYGAPSPGLTSRFPAQPPSFIDSIPIEPDTKEHPETSLANAEQESANPAAHRRDLSIDSQKDFVNTLASRRRQVQQNLKSFAESENGQPASDWQRDMRPSPLGILKTKTSKSSLSKAVDAGQSKGIKMLGLSSAVPNTVPSPKPTSEDLWKREEEEMLQPIVKLPRPQPAQVRNFRQARRDAQRDRERELFARKNNVAGTGHDNDISMMPPTQPAPPPPIMASSAAVARRTSSPSRPMDLQDVHPAHRVPAATGIDSRSSSRGPREMAIANGSDSRSASRIARDRSSSEVSSGRSKSRTGRLRDPSPAMSRPSFSPRPSLESQGGYSTRSPGMSAGPFSRNAAMASPALSEESPANSGADYFGADLGQQIVHESVDIGASPRPSPVTPFSANSTPPLAHPEGPAAFTRIPPRKRPVNKAEISEPMLMSSTSRISTVELPPGLHGMEGAPPVPPINPRRRQKTTTMFSVLSSQSADGIHTPPMPSPTPEEVSSFSGDEADARPRPRRLRKSSSEGGHLNARARQAAAAMPSPALPRAVGAGAATPPLAPAEGGMF